MDVGTAVQSPWNSLEVAKFAVSLATPFLVGVITFLVARAGARIDKLKVTNQVLISRRVELYSEMAPKLNDIYCYFSFLGGWKMLTPSDVVGRKRDLDRIIHVNKPLFSEELFTRYSAIMEIWFQTFAGYGEDAKLRIDREVFTKFWTSVKNWDAAWLDHLSETVPVSRKDIRIAYDALMRQFAVDIGAVGG